MSGALPHARRPVASGPVSNGECIFCQIVAGSLPAQIIAEGERTLAFMDVNPATRGHALVVPRRHATDLLEVPAQDLEATVVCAQALAKKMIERLDADGVNLLNACRPAAWQTVLHFHVHVIPRYRDDPLKLPWTPRPGEPDDIAAAAQALR
jgi:histidine triad (HIT) family protein